MAITDFLSGASEFLNLDDIAGSFIDETFGDFLGGEIGKFATDLVGGAVTNAAIAGLAGGDMGEAALWGAAGGALGYADVGGFGDDMQNFASGYGIGEATGGDGFLSGGLSVLGGRLAGEGKELGTEEESYSSRSGGGGGTGEGGGNAPDPEGGSTTNVPQETKSVSAGLSKKLQDLGIITEQGEGTLLGKALVTGVKGMAEQKNTEDLLETKQEYAKERDTHQSDLEHKNEQRRIAAFSNRSPGFQINRTQ